MMCEANIYLLNNEGREELYFESVDKITPENSQIVMEDIFGRQKILSARIKNMSLVSHRIVLEMMEADNQE